MQVLVMKLTAGAVMGAAALAALAAGKHPPAAAGQAAVAPQAAAETVSALRTTGTRPPAFLGGTAPQMDEPPTPEPEQSPVQARADALYRKLIASNALLDDGLHACAQFMKDGAVRQIVAEHPGWIADAGPAQAGEAPTLLRRSDGQASAALRLSDTGGRRACRIGIAGMPNDGGLQFVQAWALASAGGLVELPDHPHILTPDGLFTTTRWADGAFKVTLIISPPGSIDHPAIVSFQRDDALQGDQRLAFLTAPETLPADGEPDLQSQ